MTAVQALLVDMDGTLVDTATANYEAYAAALAAAGVRVARREFDEVAQGRNWRQFLPGLLAGGGSDADAAEVAAHKAELYPTKIPLSRVNDALVGLIETGRAQWKTALVTTASAANVSAVLGHHRLTGLFDVIVTGSDVARHKPDPEAYHLAALRLAVRPEDCVIVEDSDIGVRSAAAFGARCLRISFPVDGQ